MACKHWRKKTSDVHCLGAWSLQCVLMLLFTSCHTNRGSLALLPGKSHGQRSLVGCSPWGCEESDTTERLHFHFHALKAMATHSSVLAWRIPGKGEPGGLPSMGSHRVRHGWSDLAAAAAAAAAVTRPRISEILLIFPSPLIHGRNSYRLLKSCFEVSPAEIPCFIPFFQVEELSILKMIISINLQS